MCFGFFFQNAGSQLCFRYFFIFFYCCEVVRQSRVSLNQQIYTARAQVLTLSSHVWIIMSSLDRISFSQLRANSIHNLFFPVKIHRKASSTDTMHIHETMLAYTLLMSCTLLSGTVIGGHARWWMKWDRVLIRKISKVFRVRSRIRLLRSRPHHTSGCSRPHHTSGCSRRWYWWSSEQFQCFLGSRYV